LGDFKIVFIIDGYEEMKKELRGLNLFTTNYLELLRPSDDNKFEYPKVIITSRTSCFFVDDDYEKSF